MATFISENIISEGGITGTSVSATTITGTNFSGNGSGLTNVSANFTGGTVTGATTFTSTVNISGTTTVGSDVVALQYLKSLNSTGDEGGEIFLSKAVTNTTLTNGVTIDVYQNKLRFFEQGGTARGAFIDLSLADAGVGSNLLSLTSTQVFATTTTTINAATYIDITGCSVSLAAGTWLITGTVIGAAVNTIIQCFLSIRDGSNNVIAATAMSRPASGTANLNAPIGTSWSAIVTPTVTTTYKLSAARGLTTHTATWTVYDGTGYNTANHANDATDKGTNILAIRLA